MFDRQQMPKLVQHHGGQQHNNAGNQQAATAGAILLQVKAQVQKPHGQQRNDVKGAVIGDSHQM
ncbi:hypothetical protein D3C87_2059190 [compost metagenome]